MLTESESIERDIITIDSLANIEDCLRHMPLLNLANPEVLRAFNDRCNDTLRWALAEEYDRGVQSCYPDLHLKDFLDGE